MNLLRRNELPEHLKVDIKSINEERANMLSHGLGVLLFLALIPFLISYAAKTGMAVYLVSVILYSISLLMVYTASTLYHSSYDAKYRRRLKIFDHVSIYFLIAGTYSPFILTHLRTTAGWVIFIVLWSMVVIGSIVKLFHVEKFKLISTLAYLVMGWLVIFIIKPLYLLLPEVSFYWILIGGVSYTAGVFFYLKESIRYNHLVWHLFVLGGSVSHFVAVYFCV